jgi:hypothetical protein
VLTAHRLVQPRPTASVLLSLRVHRVLNILETMALRSGFCCSRLGVLPSPSGSCAHYAHICHRRGGSEPPQRAHRGPSARLVIWRHDARRGDARGGGARHGGCSRSCGAGGPAPRERAAGPSRRTHPTALASRQPGRATYPAAG